MKKILTVKNQQKLYTHLKKYLSEVLADEEYLNSFEACKKEAERVELYGNKHYITPALVSDWLRGLPISTAYMTYNICCMMFDFLGLPKNQTFDGLEKQYAESAYDLDCFYWSTLGKIIYMEG